MQKPNLTQNTAVEVNPFDDEPVSTQANAMYDSFQKLSMQPQNYARPNQATPVVQQQASVKPTPTANLPQSNINLPPRPSPNTAVTPSSMTSIATSSIKQQPPPASSIPAPPPIPATGLIKTSPRSSSQSQQQNKMSPRSANSLSQTTQNSATRVAVSSTPQKSNVTPTPQNTPVSAVNQNKAPLKTPFVPSKPQQPFLVSSDLGQPAKEAEKIDIETWEKAEKSKKSGVDIDTLRGVTAKDNIKFKNVNANFAPMKQSTTWE
jgi:hypothetical protein